MRRFGLWLSHSKPLALGLGLGRWWLAEVVGFVASTSVGSAMDGGASSLGSTDRFSARTDATSTPAFPQSIRDEDVNVQANCHRALGNVPHRCCMAVRVDGLCVPHFLEVRSFPYVNLLVGRRISRWSAEASSSSIVRDICTFCSATQRSAGSELIPCSGARANACSLHRRHHEPSRAVAKVAVKTTPSIREETPELIPSPANVSGVPSARSSAEPCLGEASGRQSNFRWLVEHNSLRASVGATVVAKCFVEQ